MAGQLNITIIQNNGGTVTTSTVVVPISAGLQAMDSGQQASTQSGYSAADQQIRNIFKAREFFVPSTNTWYPVAVIQSITAQ